MKLLLQLFGFMGLTGIVILIALVVVGFVVWMVVKKRLGNFFIKAMIAASPPRLHLVRELAPAWDDHDEVGERVDALRALGFHALGTFGCKEQDQFQLVALAHPQEGVAAAVFEHPQQGCWTDLAVRFRDTGEYLVVSSAKLASKMPKVPGIQKIFDPKASTEKLYRIFHKKLGHHLVSPVGPDNYVSFFETFYETEMQGYYDALGIEPDLPFGSHVEVDRDPALDQACAPLFRAIAQRDLAQLQQQIQQLASSGSSLEGRDEDGKTPLMAAVMTGDLSFVEPLIAAGADVEAVVPTDPDHPFRKVRPWDEAFGRPSAEHQAAAATMGRLMSAFGASTASLTSPMTPLLLAIWTGNEQVASALVQAGASPVGSEGPRPLHYAVERGDIHMVNLVLRSGVELEQRNEEDATALMKAVRRGDLELVQWLLEAGADVDLKDEDGDTALTLAAEEGYDDIFEVLVPRAKKNIRKARKALADWADNERNLAGYRLRSAARDGEIARLQRLLGQGLPPDAQEYDDAETPLMVAAEAGDLRAVRMLLDAGAHVNFRTEDGDTPLSSAVDVPEIDLRTLPDMVQMLIDAGASLDALEADSRQRVMQVLQSRGGVLPA